MTMSAAARSASAVYLAYTTPFQDVIVRNVAASPQTTIALGGRLIGGPALAVAPAGVLRPTSALVVFGRGLDNALWWRHQTATGWTGWGSLGGRLTSKPAAAIDMSLDFGRLNVFVRGTDGFLWYRVLGPAGWGRWSSTIGDSHERSGLLLTGTGPGASANEVAFVHSDQHVIVLGRGGMANHFIDFGGRTTAEPGITRVQGSLPVVAFARGLDNALWYEESDLPLGPRGWHRIGGGLTSGVTAATVPGGKTYVFVLGTDNRIWMKAGIWPALGGWTRL
jgi:hypothetical protein